MQTRGFFLLENLIVFTLGILLLLACIYSYSACLKTMQKKLILEEAITVAEKVQAQQAPTTTLQVEEQVSEINISNINTALIIKEVQVSYNGKVIFNLATIP